MAPLCAGIDCVVHLAGTLFVARPQRVLPRTNIEFVQNLVRAAREAGVRKFILISFPHAEGESTPERPATGRLETSSNVIHFRTRLQAEKAVFASCQGSGMTPIIFRAGIAYGKGLKLFEAARWMLRYRLLAIWPEPTWAHLISTPDFLTALRAAIQNQDTSGIYQVCDDGPLYLQDLLDKMADHWGYSGPWKLPSSMFHLAGWGCEMLCLLTGTAAPINRDIIRAGMTSCVADNSRMKRELLPALAYPTIDHGIELL